ncbi:MAG: exodeoxyribonuclease VII large subunit [Saprospiraceae bacterium]|nr:exodeoxyribonuclease VII large subunit [Saprospiraceae bacterium]
MNAISLFELNEYIRQVIALNFTEPLWIRAEINQLSFSRGHCYLDLVEKQSESDEVIAQASAAIWYRNLKFIEHKTGAQLNQLLQKGIQVLLKVKVEFSERYGLKFSVEDIDTTYTLGMLELKRREILAQLTTAGLLEKNKQLYFPAVLQKLAIISSEKAAGLQDFVNHLQDNSYQFAFDCELYPAAMQGKNMEREILKALKDIHRSRINYDAIVLIRGGGSKLDLAAFDGLQLCTAIANSAFPVITGIGHDIDQSIADLVAHTSLKTPTAVANYVIDHNLRFESQLITLYRNLEKSVRHLIHGYQKDLHYLGHQVKEQSLHLIQRKNINLSHSLKELTFHASHRLKSEHLSLDNASQKIKLLDPRVLLQRGYSLTFCKGELIKDNTQVNDGDTLETRVALGNIYSIVHSSTDPI